MTRLLLWVVTACAIVVGCSRTPDGACPVSGVIDPPQADVNVGDQVSLQLKTTDFPCQGVFGLTPSQARWAVGDAVSLDSVRGFTLYVRALHQGYGEVDLTTPGGPGLLAMSQLFVYEPAGADTVMSAVWNWGPDSAIVSVLDAQGATVRSVLVHGDRDTVCVVTPLSDSVGYHVQVFGNSRTGTIWVHHAATLAFFHTFNVMANETVSPIPMQVGTVEPDGC